MAPRAAFEVAARARLLLQALPQSPLLRPWPLLARPRSPLLVALPLPARPPHPQAQEALPPLLLLLLPPSRARSLHQPPLPTQPQ